jgi:hypothetical protein
VGHTANFTRRKSGHKHACNTDTSKNYNLKIYQTIRENGGWDNWRMIEIKNQLCESKRHAVRLEQELIDQYKAELNSRKAFGADTKIEYRKQYVQDNKEQIMEYKKQYYNDNKEEILEINKQYYLDNKEKILECCKNKYNANKEKQLDYAKQYNQNNKEKIADYRKMYNLKNREKIAETNRLYRLKKKAEKEKIELKELV